MHTIWRVYSLGSDRGPSDLGGTYVGEQGTVAAGSQAGGNWIYGGPNAEVGMLASGVVQDAGYNLATGIGGDDDQAQAVASLLRPSPPAARSRRR